MHGRIRGGPDAPWMPIVAEQHNVLVPAARLFYFDGSMAGVPLQGYHRYVDASASMLVRLAALIPVARASGDEMTRSETVTLFNDMCVLAPATLLSPAIAWEPVGRAAVPGRASRTAATRSGPTCRSGPAASWSISNPTTDPAPPPTAGSNGCAGPRRSAPTAAFGPVRLASTGEGRWHERAGDYAYIELTIDEVRYNVRPLTARPVPERKRN